MSAKLAGEMGNRVLILSEDAIILDQARLQLEDRFEVVTASAADNGLRVLEEEGPFALVLADLSPDGPVWDGILECLYSLPSDTALMLLGNGPMGVPPGVMLH
ncbi:hypothetical protein [Pararhodospirillum oryzae]|uniref:Response regulatory domain-containing protein n=1 Tax=Pararhodospirillum oryzae TaxID=478448 RepID=A0A512H4L1_9PROT|nr:hypothetical protein [Pararhodospirillum oryzae]GEO80320.1 hypothetical protein ROR02_04510 [Pararhodospirillum oryzae]